MNNQQKAAGRAASELISEKIAELGDWRGKTLARMRALIKEADPEVAFKALIRAAIALNASSKRSSKRK